MERIEQLLELPYWVVDVLPEQVNADGAARFFPIERYWLAEPQRSDLRRRKTNLLLKLNCYADFTVADVGENPAPETLARLIGTQRLCILTRDALITTEPDDLYMTVYHPDGALLNLLRTLAASEGLFVRKPDGRQSWLF